MSWYRTGTIAVNGTTVTGTGTNWTDNKMGIGPGQALLIPGAGTVKMYEILRVDSATKLTLTSDAGTVGAAQAYAIMSFYTDSVPDFARRLSAQLSYYQSQMDGWQQIMTGTGSVTVQAPDGTQVTISSFRKMSDDIAGKAAKGDNRDITSLSGLTTALSIAQGGTGGTTTDAARVGMQLGGRILTLGSINNVLTYHNDRWPTGGIFPLRDDDATTLGYQFGSGLLFRSSDTYGYLVVNHNNANARIIGGSVSGGVAQTAYVNTLWGSRNTTVDNNGFIKQASPVVKIFSNGEFEVNDESEGVTVTHSGPGEYLIEGCVGLNADASWGGTDGGFEIPVDRNKQARIWLDYEVNADGSVLVKTYHRTYPEAPVFARNIIGNKNEDGTFTETVKNGDQADIPADSFVSVRVEMPADSIWNQKTEASRKATEEVSRKALEESKAISNMKEA